MSFMPMDPTNPLYRLLNPGAGIGGIAQRGPSWLPPGAGFGGFGVGQQDQPAQPQQGGLRGLLRNPDFALALLANSGGPQKKSFGEVIGQAGLQANQIGQQRQDDAFQQQYRQAQMEALQNKKQGGPQSVQEYEYAKQNGFQGSFQDWITAGGQSSRPSSVQEWEFFNKLPPKDQDRYLTMKRAQMQKIEELAGGKNVVTASPLGNVSTTPLTTLPQEAAAAETIKQAEGRGGAVGTAQGQIVGGIQTKGSDAQQMMGAIDMAGGLLNKSTGSWVGSLIDKGAAAFGKSTEGAQAGAQLKVLQASLLSFVPKMSGPQSDADREVYIQAVGQIGDTNTPVETRRSALKTVQDMQNKYIQNAQGGAPPAGGQPRRRKYNPATGQIE